ncbi:MAG: hypothetical protein JJE25_09300 [Bacteroidia bacterium]|nr:hypothetical protein [Bacteroidia bacterium]
MKKLSIIISAVVLLASCSKESDDLATPSSTISGNGFEKSAAARTFLATFNASVNANSPNPPTACSGDAPFVAPDFLLNGAADHMGKINAQTSTLHHDACNLNLTDMELTTSVSGQIVAANGHKIFYTGNDVVDVTNFVTAAGTTGSITGTWTITGGTGRFEGATGSFTINGTVDFVTNTFSCQAVGTITY